MSLEQFPDIMLSFGALTPCSGGTSLKNILLIVVDTLRPDHLGCYGYNRPTSPCLDALAEKSTVLNSLWSASNFTAPAFTSLFTGLYPHQHGVFDFTVKAPSSPIYDLLKQNQMNMAGVVSFRFFGNLLKNIWGDVEAVTDTRSFDFSKDLPQAVTESSLAWLKENGKSGPFCLFAHYDGPHLPFRLPDQYADAFDTIDQEQVDDDFLRLLFPQDKERLDADSAKKGATMFQLIEDINWGRRKVSPDTMKWMKDKYDASILYNDRAIGDLLEGMENLGLADDTIVVVLSDHGEEFLEHGAIGHGGIHLHEEIIRTVGIVHEPGGPEGQRVSRPLSQVDIFPTLCHMAGATGVPESWSKRSFADLVSSGNHTVSGASPVFCHGKSKIAARDQGTKFIKTRPTDSLDRMTRLKLIAKMLLRREFKSELFDLEKDSLEKKNLIGQRDLRNRMEDIVKQHFADRSGGLAATDADDEERRRIEQEMKDLGYM